MPGIFPGVFYLLYRKPRVYPGLDALVLEQYRPDAHDVDHLARGLDALVLEQCRPVSKSMVKPKVYSC